MAEMWTEIKTTKLGRQNNYSTMETEYIQYYRDRITTALWRQNKYSILETE